MLAYKTKRDILPIYIETKNQKSHIFKRTTIHIGELIKNSELNILKGGKEEYIAAASLVSDRIMSLAKIQKA